MSLPKHRLATLLVVFLSALPVARPTPAPAQEIDFNRQLLAPKPGSGGKRWVPARGPLAFRGESRAEVIGNHTDHQKLHALGTNLPELYTELEIYEVGGDEVELISESIGGDAAACRFALGSERSTLGDPVLGRLWWKYPRGIVNELALAGLLPRIGGFKGRIRSTVPGSSGMSSSAALEVAILEAVNSVFRLGLSPTDIAKLGQRVENGEFVGAPTGLLDQFLIAHKKMLLMGFGAAEIDYRELRLSPRYKLFILNARNADGSRFEHDNSAPPVLEGDGDAENYAQRKLELTRFAERMGLRDYRGEPTIQFATRETFAEYERRYGKDRLYQRAWHSFREDSRALRAAEALDQGSGRRLGQLLNASARSMRESFRNTLEPTDALVRIAQAYARRGPGGSTVRVYGARPMGGGWTGMIIGVADAGFEAGDALRIFSRFGDETGYDADLIYLGNPHPGGR